MIARGTREALGVPKIFLPFVIARGISSSSINQSGSVIASSKSQYSKDVQDIAVQPSRLGRAKGETFQNMMALRVSVCRIVFRSCFNIARYWNIPWVHKAYSAFHWTTWEYLRLSSVVTACRRQPEERFDGYHISKFQVVYSLMNYLCADSVVSRCLFRLPLRLHVCESFSC